MTMLAPFNPNASIKLLLLQRCVDAHKAHAQYAEAYTADKWRLVVATKDLVFKSGEIKAGTVTLAKMHGPKFGEVHVDIGRGAGGFQDGIEPACFTVVDFGHEVPYQCGTADASGLVFLD